LDTRSARNLVISGEHLSQASQIKTSSVIFFLLTTRPQVNFCI
jgi:hypothetical protein